VDGVGVDGGCPTYIGGWAGDRKFRFAAAGRAEIASVAVHRGGVLCISVGIVRWGERHSAVLVLGYVVFSRYEAVCYDGQSVTHQSILVNHVWFKSTVIKI
jgi:hypothetical protein